MRYQPLHLLSLGVFAARKFSQAARQAIFAWPPANVVASRRRRSILGVPDVFAPTGTAEFLLEHFGLTANGIERAALELLKEA